MSRLLMASFCLWTSSAHAAAVGESLQYTINWPSGLSLGEGRLTASKGEKNWNFEFQFEAMLPGFTVADRFASLTNNEQCSLTFDKELLHGKHKTQEKIAFDSESGKVTRQTVGGGKSELAVTGCARDALAFIFHLRRELAQGRIPSPQSVYYGSPYRVRLEYKGGRRIRIGEAMEDSDHVLAYIKGPSSEFNIEMFFGKDAARTPLMVRLPLNLGTFSMELVR